MSILVYHIIYFIRFKREIKICRTNHRCKLLINLSEIEYLIVDIGSKNALPLTQKH
jgi:hypothetical protein